MPISFFKKTFYLSFVAILTLSIIPMKASATNKLIDLDRVSTATKKRLVKIGADQFTSPEQFTLSCGSTFNTTEYSFNHMAFEVDQDLEKVWDLYANSNPKSAWNGKSIQFDFAYSKRDEAAYYRDDSLPAIHVGMGFFLILDLYGLKKIPVGLEISKIDSASRTFEYTYLEQNVSHGRQTVHFLDLGNHRTRIVHDTYFTSGNKLRDRLYPPIHEALLTDFHQNVLKQATLKPLRVE